MCLTLTNATAVIDRQPSPRPAVRGYTRTWHPAAELSPGDLWRPDPDRDPHTVTEVHHLRNQNDHSPERVTVVDQYAHAYTYRSDELVPTAVPDTLTVHLTRQETTR